MDLLSKQSELFENDKLLKAQTIKEQQEISFLKEKLKSDTLAYKRKMAENTGAFKQAKKDVKKMSKELRTLRRDAKRKDVQIRSLVSELRLVTPCILS